MYPCDRGMSWMDRGYHHFQAGPTGIVCCVYCGILAKQPESVKESPGDKSDK